jgi:hypothetical protein
MNFVSKGNSIRGYFWATVVCVLYLTAETAAQKDDIRGTMAVLPSDMYSKMISTIPAGEWEKLDECFQSIEPLFSSIDREFNTSYTKELDESIKASNTDDAMYLLAEVAVYGIISHLEDAKHVGNRSEVSNMTRTAFAEFLSIETQFKKQYFKRCRQIVMLFRKSYSLSGDTKRYNDTTNELIRNLTYLVEKSE